MEHVLPHPSPPGPERHHPWRTIAVVAGALAMLELLGLVVVGIALVAKPMAHRAITEAAKAPAVTKPKPEPMLPLLPRRLVSVTILNGNGVSGAAASGRRAASPATSGSRSSRPSTACARPTCTARSWPWCSAAEIK